MNPILKVFIFSVAAYAYMFVITKILGKKQIAQLSFTDYVTGISIGSIAANMATETEQPVYHFLIAMAAFAAFDLAVTLLSRKSKSLKAFLSGRPLTLIKEGKFDYKQIKRSKLTVDDLAGMARDKGFFDINDAAYAILETSGALSILPKSQHKPIDAKDLNLTPAPAHLIIYIVVDGKIDHDGLNHLNRDKKWLLDGLKTSEEQLYNILLATYDEQEKVFSTHYKYE